MFKFQSSSHMHVRMPHSQHFYGITYLFYSNFLFNIKKQHFSVVMKNTVGAIRNLWLKTWLNFGGLPESTHRQIQDCPLEGTGPLGEQTNHFDFTHCYQPGKWKQQIAEKVWDQRHPLLFKQCSIILSSRSNMNLPICLSLAVDLT